MDNNYAARKAILSLVEYLDGLSGDRPKMGIILRDMHVDPKVMSDVVRDVARCIQVTYPETAIDIANQLFKMGVTLGYKFAIKTEMEREFGSMDSDPDMEE